MGNIKAFNAVVKSQNETVDFNHNNNIDYYNKILKDALITFEPYTENYPRPETTDSIKDLENLLKEYWVENWQDIEIIGYIKQDNHHAKNRNSILQKIAKEENKYFYKWLENDQKILEKLNLVRLNVLVYNNIFFDKKQSQNKFVLNNQALNILFNSLTMQRSDVDNKKKAALFFMPIVISFENFKKNNDNYYGVYVNKVAKSSYLNTCQDTELYQYKKNDNNTQYEYVKTWKFGKEESKNIQQNRPHFKVKDNDNTYAEFYFEGESNLEIRYYHYLRLKLKDSSIRGSVFQQKTRENISGKVNKLEQDKAVKIQQEAQNKAHQVPNSYQCFYYENNGLLDSFISSVSTAEGSAGLGGYAMRADTLSEVDYKWSITADSEEDKHLAKLLSYIMDLERDKFVDKESEVSLFKGNNDGFFPTNWPSDKVQGMKSLFHYYKNFKENVKRRNKPEQPQHPRIAHSENGNYPYKYDDKNDFKLTNRSYRIWKKGEQFQMEELSTGSSDTRLDAGSVMAEALNKFNFYKEMVKAKDSKATYAKLPATAFAKYVVAKDDTAKEQWAKDTEVEVAEINKASVNTDQEWCHLFGHGDGGPEELGNFVSGSKHCNTEQLAIETGQRRISQNESLKVELRAKITAYLMPNDGAWITAKKTEVKQLLFGNNPKNDEWKELLFGKKSGEDITDSADKTLWEDFFTSNDNNGNYTETQMKNLFQKLSKAIGEKGKDEQGLKDRTKLFKVRRELESNFFLYLPLGRWMRYKIYYDNKKIFDHIYDAQSQSCDLNECKILDYTVERAIYKGLDKNNFFITDPEDSNKEFKAYEFYKKKIKERVKDLVPSAEEASLIDSVIQISDDLKKTFNNLISIDKFADNILADIEKLNDDLSKENVVSNEVSGSFDQLKGLRNLLNKFIQERHQVIMDSKQKHQETINSFSKLSQQQQNKSILANILQDAEKKIQEFSNNVNQLQTTSESIKKKIDDIGSKLMSLPLPKNLNSEKEDLKMDLDELKRKRKATEYPEIEGMRQLKKAKSTLNHNDAISVNSKSAESLI